MGDSRDSSVRGADRPEGIGVRAVAYGHDRGELVERRKPERRAVFLADISRILFEAVDYEDAASTVARLAMPELRAWAIVDLIDEDLVVRRIGVFHPATSIIRLAEDLQAHYPPEQGDVIGAPRIMGMQQPELVAEATIELLKERPRDERYKSILETLGFCSYMVLPLKARGRLLGAFTFLGAHPGHRFTPRDLLFAEDLAARTAMAMDNLRLFQEAQLAREEAVAAVARATLADRAKTDFLATMSHELRTPLNAIAGYAELLELGMRGPVTEQQRESIVRIRKSQQHLLGIVNDILTFAKTETGRIPLHLEETELVPALEQVHFLVEPMLTANDLQFDYLSCDAGLAVVADRDRLHQILVNLLSNAAKFSSRGGPVSVKCEVRGHLVAINVEDKGRGISQDKLETIFEPFVQLSTGLTRTADGSGLGLAISRELARMMGGDVTVASKEGEGSVFTLTMPMSPPTVPVL